MDLLICFFLGELETMLIDDLPHGMSIILWLKPYLVSNSWNIWLSDFSNVLLNTNWETLRNHCNGDSYIMKLCIIIFAYLDPVS